MPSKFLELPPFDYTLYEENCGVEWKKWRRLFEWYLEANRMEDDGEKFVKLLHLAGRNPSVGLLNFVGKFIPNLAGLTDPLRLLIRKESPFVWNTEQNVIFQNLKESLSVDLVLGFYCIEDRTQIYADAPFLRHSL